MALAPSWDTVAAPGLRARDFSLPRPRADRPVPRYPAGRHRGMRTSWLRALFTALIPAPAYAGRHRPGGTTRGYAGRHRA
ncbi:MAG: hypothetical protein GX344_03255 [Intrasporangiaceae bacterium]|nr:hypothetical protein [Intrasporangiaceae bacterium]